MVADTTAISYLPTATITTGSAAKLAVTRQLVKHEDLSQKYAFVPIAMHMESRETFSKSVLDFLHELRLRATTVKLDSRETGFRFQNLSIAIQRFNAVCFANTFFHKLSANFFKVFVSNLCIL